MSIDLRTEPDVRDGESLSGRAPTEAVAMRTDTNPFAVDPAAEDTPEIERPHPGCRLQCRLEGARREAAPGCLRRSEAVPEARTAPPTASAIRSTSPRPRPRLVAAA